MSVNTTKINCTLYLEGVQVPFTSVQITERKGYPPTCGVTFPITTKALKLLPGTIVHIFGEVPIRGVYSDSNNNSLGKIETKDVLLFEGELTGYGYSKTDASRSISVTAESFMYHWSRVFKRSVDLVSNQSYIAALYVMTSSAYELPLTTAVSKETELTKKEVETYKGEKMKYQKFEYNTGTSNSLGGIFNFLITAWKVCEENDAKGSTAKARGDWYPFFINLLKSVEALNHYYSVFSKAFKINDSVFTFPNVAIVDALSYSLGENLLKKQDASMGENVTLLALIMQILNFISYGMLFPSAPTYTNHLTVEDKKVPVRTYFLPDLKWGPPILSNVIFPSETINVQYSRSLSGEPTRLMAGSPPLLLRSDAESMSTFRAHYLAPGLPFLNIDNSNETSKSLYAKLNPTVKSPYVLSFTPEETYRGVKAEVSTITGIEESFLKKLWTEQGKVESVEERDKKAIQALAKGDNSEGALALNAAMLSFFNARYGSRSCSISASWNPFRVVGLPALVFDTDTSPAITGLLEEHSTHIDANGTASSTMTLSYSRVLWDAEDQDSLKELIANRSLTEQEQISNQFSSWGADPIPFLPEWLDPSWYDTAHIGRDVYSIISTGKRPRKTNTPGDSNWGTESNAGGPEHSMEMYIETFTKNNTDNSLTIDSSIFNLLRDPFTGKFTANREGRDAIYSVDESTEELNVITAKRMAHAVRVLKRQYEKAIKTGREREFVINFTSRNLISKEQYWEFLLNEKSSTPNINQHYKMTNSDGSVEDMDPVTINRLIVDYMSNGSPSMFDYLNTVDDEFKDLLKPFTKKRRDHVVAINAGTKNK